MDADTKAYLDRLRDLMAGHFEALEARLGSRMDTLESGLGGLGGRIDQLDLKIDRVEANLTRRIDRLDAKLSDRIIRIERHLGLERF